MDRKEVQGEMSDSRTSNQDTDKGPPRRRRDSLDHIARAQGLDANALVQAVTRGPEGGDLRNRRTDEVVLSKEDIAQIWKKLDPHTAQGELVPAIRNEIGAFLLEAQARRVADARLRESSSPRADTVPDPRPTQQPVDGRVVSPTDGSLPDPRPAPADSSGTKVWARDNSVVNVYDNSNHLTVKLSTGKDSVPRERVAELSRLIHSNRALSSVGDGLLAAVESSIVPGPDPSPRVALSPTTWNGH